MHSRVTRLYPTIDSVVAVQHTGLTPVFDKNDRARDVDARRIARTGEEFSKVGSRPHFPARGDLLKPSIRMPRSLCARVTQVFREKSIEHIQRSAIAPLGVK